MSERKRKKSRRERITEGLEINRKGEYRTLPLTPDMDIEPKTLPLDPNTEIRIEKMSKGGGIAIKGTGFKGVR